MCLKVRVVGLRAKGVKAWVGSERSVDLNPDFNACFFLQEMDSGWMCPSLRGRVVAS